MPSGAHQYLGVIPQSWQPTAKKQIHVRIEFRSSSSGKGKKYPLEGRNMFGRDAKLLSLICAAFYNSRIPHLIFYVCFIYLMFLRWKLMKEELLKYFREWSGCSLRLYIWGNIPKKWNAYCSNFSFQAFWSSIWVFKVKYFLIFLV